MTGVEGVGHVPAEWQNGSANGIQVFLALQRAEHFVDKHLESLGAGRGQPSLERFSEQGMQVVFVAVLRGFVHVTPSLLCLDFVDERQFNHRYDWLIWQWSTPSSDALWGITGHFAWSSMGRRYP